MIFLDLPFLSRVSLYACSVNIGSADLNAVVLAYHDNLVECDLALSVELLDEDDVALFNLILLSACFDYCVHFVYLFLFRLAASGLHFCAYELFPLMGTTHPAHAAK